MANKKPIGGSYSKKAKAHNPEDQPLFDALPKLVKRAEELLLAAGLQSKCVVGDAGVKTDITVNDDSWSDPSIEFDNTGIGVCIAWGEQKTIVGERQVITYGAYATTFHPGVMYYPDGSGEPPSEDYVPLGEESQRPDDALTEALKALVAHRLYELFEHESDLAEERFLAEMEALDNTFTRDE